MVLAGIMIQVACSQTPARRSLSNELSAQHIAVTGTQVSLIPPPGFVPSNNFTGFQQDSTGSSIMVMDIPGNFGTLLDAFTPEAMRTQGMRMTRKESLVINGRDAFLIDAEQPAYGLVFTKYILGLDTDDGVVMINGVHPDDLSGQEAQAIRDAVLSVVHDPARNADPLQALNFTIDTGPSKLQLANVLANTMMFTVDGQAPTQSTDKTALMVGSSIAEMTIEDRAAFAESRLRQMPTLGDIVIEETRTVEIDGMPGIELVAYGTDSRARSRKLVFQTMLFGESLYYLIVGTTIDAFTENLAMFRTVTQTFARKS